jgi:peptidoglycan hydrolase-like protein with peptidoglycan-binding domain/DNA invertase Pin-like site-specific DNA recombinase
MQPTTDAVAGRLGGTIMGILALAALVTAPQASAAAPDQSEAGSPTAGLLAHGAGYEHRDGSARVRAVQLRLRSVGEIPGPIDGRFGPATEAAVRRFQFREGLAVDGIVGPKTRAALRRGATTLRLGAGYAEPRDAVLVRALQRQLRSAGVHPGPVDGRFGSRTDHAVRRFQAREGLAVDGIAGYATRARLQRRLGSVDKSGSKAAPAAGHSDRTNTAPPPSTASGSSSGAGASTDMIGLAAALALVFGTLALTLASRAHRRELATPTGGALVMAGLPEKPAAAEPVPVNGDPTADPTRVFGYACVDPAVNGSIHRELQRQAQEISVECARRGLSLVEIVHEREPRRGGALQRPALAYALGRISSGDAEGLVVADLSRLSRSVPELGPLLEWFSQSDARLVASAQGLDTEEEAGGVVMRTLIEVCCWERQRLIERTRRGMQAARRKGPPGVADNPALRERIAHMRSEGMTLQAIADRLNTEGVPTVRGGAKWRPSSVQAAAGYKRPAWRSQGPWRKARNGNR